MTICGFVGPACEAQGESIGVYAKDVLNAADGSVFSTTLWLSK